jgi:broad specificity phosphatase PhoE
MSSDGGLNQIGKDLAMGLHGRLRPQGDLFVPTDLIASPKKRAQETLLPLSKALNMQLKTDIGLDERQHDETSAEFRLRVKNYLVAVLKKHDSSAVVYLCTHADWLEDAMLTLPSDIPTFVAESGFACGEYRAFEFNGEIWKFLK